VVDLVGVGMRCAVLRLRRGAWTVPVVVVVVVVVVVMVVAVVLVPVVRGW